MAVTVKNLIPAKTLATTQIAQYTATNCKAIIDKFTITNVATSGIATFSTNLIASGGSAGDSNLIVKTRSVVPGETYLCPELVGQVLESGGVISTIASSATALTLAASGREVT